MRHFARKDVFHVVSSVTKMVVGTPGKGVPLLCPQWCTWAPPVSTIPETRDVSDKEQTDTKL